MSLKEQLIGAIKEEDNEKLSDVLEQMCVEEVNEKDEYGETALYKACRRKNNQAVSLLLAKLGINVNVKNSYYGRTPFHVACENNNDWVIDQLLRCPGIHENAKNNNGSTLIMMAALGCSKEALGVMFKSPRVDLDVKDNGGRGLEEYVGILGGGEEGKTKCLDMIREERIRRKTLLGEESLKIGIEKIERIDKKIEDCEQRWKENVDSRKLKRREMYQKHSSSFTEIMLLI